MNCMKVKAVHNGHGYTGKVTDEETYYAVLEGKRDWPPTVKPDLTHITIPYSIFLRLVEIDRKDMQGKATEVTDA